MRGLLGPVALSILTVAPPIRGEAVGRFPDVAPSSAPTSARPSATAPPTAAPAPPAPRPPPASPAPATSSTATPPDDAVRAREPSPPRHGSSNAGSNELTDRGARHEEAGRYAEAAAAYTEAVRLDPTNGEALLALGRLRVRMSDAGEAEQILTLASRLPDVAARALFERARLRKSRGREDDAIRDLESAVTLSPEEDQWVEDLAKWYVARRAWLPALSLYRRILADARGSPRERHAELEVRALRLLSDDLDPVARGRSPEYTFIRRALSRLDRVRRAPDAAQSNGAGTGAPPAAKRSSPNP